MPDEKPDQPAPKPAEQPNTAPAAPTDPSSGDTKPADGAEPAAETTPGPGAPPVAGPPPDPLSDGTTPTILETGSGEHHGKVKSGRASLKTVYERADIVTTLITFAGLIVAAVLVVGGYMYFTKTSSKPTVQPKLTQLDKDSLDKLGAFLTGDSAGSASEVLTVNSSSLFKERVGINSDLKVTGGTQVSGPTALGDLTVDKTSTLGVTNIRGQLSVSGPTTLQSPAVLSAGASITGNLTASGNGSFGGALSAGLLNVRDLSISGTLNLAGHLAVTGQTPSAAPAGNAGSGASANVNGNDSAGTVTINTGSGAGNSGDTGGLLVTITFKTPYAGVPHVLITPIGSNGGQLLYYTQKTANGFTIGVSANPKSGTSYSFDYWVVQ